MQNNPYLQIFGNRPFSRFWLGFTFSVLGDAMSRVALTWLVYEMTGSAQALGFLMFSYTAPVLIGGFVAGALLDRFDRRRLMVIDNVVRGLAMMILPLLNLAGLLDLWHIYAVTTVYGSFMMISLAGSPSLVPGLVKEDQLVTANALETVSYTLSGVVGPLAAGLLLTRLGAANIVWIDSLSYLFFAAMLASIPSPARPQTAAASPAYRWRDAFGLLFGSRVLLATTLMFMLFNTGFGAFMVGLPILADQALGGGPELYGLLLGVMAIGEVISATLAGSTRPSLPLGTLICLAQSLAGVALAALLIQISAPVALVCLFVLGVFTAPLTIWAQTLRMQIIPEALRGRTFSLLRTLMQATSPLGGVAGGFLLPLLALPVMIGLSAATIGVPGLLGFSVPELRGAGERQSVAAAQAEP